MEDQKNPTLPNADRFLSTYALILGQDSGTNPNKKLTPRNVHRRTDEAGSYTQEPTERPTPRPTSFQVFTGPPEINLAQENGTNLGANGMGRHVRRMNVTESLESCLLEALPPLSQERALTGMVRRRKKTPGQKKRKLSDSENLIDYDDDGDDQEFLSFEYDREAIEEEWRLFTQRRHLRSHLAYNNLNIYGWDMDKVS